MNLGDFHSLVSQKLNRGTNLDTRIPANVKMAAQWLERNYTFQYMERFRLLQVVEGDRTVELPTNEPIKAFKFVRFIGADGLYQPLNKVEPTDVQGIATATSNTISSAIVPSSFWTVANRILVFTAVPSENLNGEAMWWAYTDWPVELDSEHPLITIATDVLLAQTLMFTAAFDLRDARMVEAWKVLRDEGVNTLTRAEDESKYSAESQSMAFSPF